MQPFPVGGHFIQIEKGLPDRQGVAEVRSGGIGVVMRETAAGQRAMGYHPARGAFRLLPCRGIASRRIERAQRTDRPPGPSEEGST